MLIYNDVSLNDLQVIVNNWSLSVKIFDVLEYIATKLLSWMLFGFGDNGTLCHE